MMNEVTPSTGESDAARVSSAMSQVGKSWYPSWKTFERAHACMVLPVIFAKVSFHRKECCRMEGDLEVELKASRSLID